MSRKINLIIFLCFILCEVYAQYVPDVLGDGYLRRTFQMPDDYEGKVVCTLVKKPQLDSVKQAVLYIHGYNDYFFQKQLGDSVNAHGYNFYAMDLRKYGRSILPNQNPFFCKSLKEYFADIDTALATIRSEGNERILLMAHSTGGLITPYYLNSKKGELPVDGLILNSPFLDWNFGWFMEKVVLPTVAFVGRLFPNLTVQGLGDPNYAYSLLKQYKGEWEFDTNWKMIFGHPKKAGWIKAIQEAQQTVQKGLKLDCPILVMSSMARGIHDLRHRLGCSRHSKIRAETRRQSHERYHSKRHPRSDPISKALSERCLSNYIRVVKETIMVAPNI